MRAILQRVRQARVRVDEEVVGEIGAGLLILLGVRTGDGAEEARMLAKKCADLRIFSDDAGKMNRSLREIDGSALVVSQFTLFADCRKGRRPFFGDAEEPQRADQLCQLFCSTLTDLRVPVQTGSFGAMMMVELANDGPVTIILDSDELAKPRRGGSDDPA